MQGSQYLKHILLYAFPLPIRYLMVWSNTRLNDVYAWEPVPPNDQFVAMGMVFTTTDEPPPLDAIHCVPKVTR